MCSNRFESAIPGHAGAFLGSLSQCAQLQDIQAGLERTLQSLLRHVCMVRDEQSAASLSQQTLAQRFQLAALQCLKLIMSTVAVPCWSAAWAEVDPLLAMS